MTDDQLEALREQERKAWDACNVAEAAASKARSEWAKADQTVQSELRRRQIEAEVQKRLKEAQNIGTALAQNPHVTPEEATHD